MFRWCSNCNGKRDAQEEKCLNCGSKTDLELEVGDVVRIDGRREFKVTERLSKLGETGQSAVYRAERVDDPAKYGAIKVAKYNKEEALKREAEVIQKLQPFQHPHIIRLVHPERSLWQHRNGSDLLNFFALEYMDGGSLQDKLRQHNKLPLQEALAIVRAVGQALECAHQNGVIHLDVKPANILFDKQGRIVLSDFGIAREELHARKLQKRVGTLFYNSPEQLAEPPTHSRQADIYALGVILCEMLVGADRFRQYRSSSSHGSKDPPSAPAGQGLSSPSKTNIELLSPRELEPRIPVPIEQVILKATAHNLANRYSSVSEMLADLDQAASQPAPSSKAPLVLIGLAVLLALVAGLVLLAGIYFYYNSSEEEVVAGPVTSTPTPEVTREPAGATEVPIIDVGEAATWTPTPDTSSQETASDDPTAIPPTPTRTRRPTSTPTPPAVRPRNTPTPAFNFRNTRVELIEPGNNIHVPGGGAVIFRWRWVNSNGQPLDCNQALPEGYGFEIRGWPNQDYPTPPGAIAAQTSPWCEDGVRSITIEKIRDAPGVAGQGGGQTRWDVAVVQMDPYQPLFHSSYVVLYY